MLRVRTHIKQSEIKGAGLGLFTSQPIKKGDVIYIFDEGLELEFMTPKNLAVHDLSIVEYCTKYGYSHRNRIRVPLDENKYMNHSTEPNVLDNGDKAIAMHDISEGQELTCNYANLGPTREDLEFNLL